MSAEWPQASIRIKLHVQNVNPCSSAPAEWPQASSRRRGDYPADGPQPAVGGARARRRYSTRKSEWMEQVNFCAGCEPCIRLSFSTRSRSCVLICTRQESNSSEMNANSWARCMLRAAAPTLFLATASNVSPSNSILPPSATEILTPANPFAFSTSLERPLKASNLSISPSHCVNLGHPRE